MNVRSMTRAVVAGFVATLAMIFLGFIATQLGAPFLDWSRALGGFFGDNPWFGYFSFLAVGVVIAMVYVGLFHDRLPGTSWKRGLFFAVLLWLITGVLFSPLFHMGFFMGSVMVALGTLVSYMVYGAILGFIYDA